jgi:hypothetical protein
MTTPPPPGQNPSGQQPYPGYGQFPPYGAYGPPPAPKKQRSGMWIGIGFTAFVLAALLVTGFVAPGFFFGQKQAASPSSKTSVDTVARAVADAMNTQDTASLTALTCDDADKVIPSMIKSLNDVDSATLVGPPSKVTDTDYHALIDIVAQGAPASRYTATLAGEKGTWCLKSFGHLSQA